jgi:PKHD-type hydroxylase
MLDILNNTNYVDFLFINNESKGESRSFMWSEEECRNIISYSEDLEPVPGVISKNKLNQEVRKVTRWAIPNHDPYGWIYDKICKTITSANYHFWEYDIDHIETIELLRYRFDPTTETQDHYNKHSDFGAEMNRRKLSYSALLSDPKNYQGGDLVLHLEKDIICPKEKGQVTIFPSFTFHTVEPITSGERWSLVTWVSGRPLR